MQFPDVVDAWFPLGNQFLNVGSSTALTIPTPPAGHARVATVFVGILTAQLISQWIRTDGVAVVAGASGGIKMFPGDWRLIYGYESLSAVRVIRDAAGGSLAVEYFYFRPTPT